MGTLARPSDFPAPRQRGAVSIVFILSVVMLLGFVGLAMDIARLYVSKTELQSAADSCALAASAALTGANANQLTVAESYGITAGVRNRVGMQAVAVTIQADRDVTFSDALNGTYLTKGAAAGVALNMRYARCAVSEANIRTLLLQVIDALPGADLTPTTIRASAVATLEPSISNCALPLAVCKKAGSAAPNFGYVRGEWLTGRFDPPSNVTGKFKWVEFPGYSTTPALETLIGQGGQCNLSGSNTLTPRTGAINSLVDVWNWRFGVKKASGAPAGAFPPDLTGFAYTATNWPTQASAFNDFSIKRAANTPWNGLPSLGGSWSASTSAVHAGGGDRRLVVGPVVDCSSWVSGGTSPQAILGWACYLMLNPVSNPNDNMGLEYRGPASDIASGCVTSGAPGGPGAGGPKVPALVQ
ncbi:pilus assembly protein TadG-related protein [Zoogloea sp.]|uniref:pilus assembly protein TadG-related protein n=1 Tax=Zoogloea sp. TaxID=49181 RepID=UPI0031FCEDF0